jgi:hypothetical protein
MHARRRHITFFSGHGKKQEISRHRDGTGPEKMFLFAVIQEKIRQVLSIPWKMDRSKNRIGRDHGNR